MWILLVLFVSPMSARTGHNLNILAWLIGAADGWKRLISLILAITGQEGRMTSRPAPGAAGARARRYEGPLIWLLTLAREQKVDLGKISILALWPTSTWLIARQTLAQP